jgi:hypothetical protein
MLTVQEFMGKKDRWERGGGEWAGGGEEWGRTNLSGWVVKKRYTFYGLFVHQDQQMRG